MKNNSSMLKRLDSSIQKIESMWIPQNLQSDFKDLLDIKKRLSSLDESNNVDRDIIEILTRKSATIIENITKEIIANFKKDSSDIVTELRGKSKTYRRTSIRPRSNGEDAGWWESANISRSFYSSRGEDSGPEESASPSRNSYYSRGGESSTWGEC